MNDPLLVMISHQVAAFFIVNFPALFHTIKQ